MINQTMRSGEGRDKEMSAEDYMKVTELGSMVDSRRHVLKMQPEHRTMVALRATGLKPHEIAPIVGVTSQTVVNICSHPDAQEMLAQLTTDHVAGVFQEVGQAIQASSMEAYLKIVDLMRHSTKQEIQRDCAMDLLDRAGFKAKTVIVPEAPSFGNEAGRLVGALRDSRREVTEPKQADSMALIQKAVVIGG